MKKLFVFALVLIAVPAFGQQTLNYSWEDGGTTLGGFGNVCCESNVSGVQSGSQGSTTGAYTCPGAADGTYYLHVAEDPHSSTPQVYLAWVTGLTDGDVVDATFLGYDITSGSSPSFRIWGAYTFGADINNYIASASGSLTYTAGTGWDPVNYSWTFDSDFGARDGLVIQARLYSTPSTNDPDHTDYWIDDLTVTAPVNATIHFPQGPVSVEDETWAGIKALYR
jgi:hypothetical protein